MRILPYRTTENVIDGAVITFVEITEQIQQTESLKQMVELKRLATVLKDSNDAITVLDINGQITAWNKGAQKMYGYTETEAIGMNICKIVPEEKQIEITSLLQEIASGRNINSLETKRLSKDGRVMDVWLTITKLTNDKGDVISIATTERDITELLKLRKDKA